MHNAFGAQTQTAHVGLQSSSEPLSPDMMPSSGGNILGYSDSLWTSASDSLLRHQFLRASGVRNLREGESNSRFLDTEVMELFSRSRSQEEENLLLRKQVADACAKELQLLNEKHVLERKLSDLRMALDEKRDDAISTSMKELTQRKGCVEENLRLSDDLRDAEEDVYIFTSSLLSLLAEFDIRPPVMNASTVTTATKRLYQHVHRKIRPSGGNSDDNHMFGNRLVGPSSNNNHMSSRSQLSQPYMDTHTTNIHQQGLYQNDRRVEFAPNHLGHVRDYDMMDMKEVNVAPNPDMHYPFIPNKMEFPPTVYKESGSADPNFLDDNKRVATENQHNMLNMHEAQTSSTSEGDVFLPGIEGFQIIGEAKPGCTLQACGYPTRGTSLCIFQWVRHLQDGTRQSVEGATVPDYVVTADDVDTFLAVDCIPIDERGRQGELVSRFANNQNKIACDPDMQHEIDAHTLAGRAIFNVLLWIDSSEDWEPTTLILERSRYQVKTSSTDDVAIEEKYSPDLDIKVPYGLSAQFVLICSNGISLPFNTDGTSRPFSMANDIRLRDIIVLSMRIFQTKALESKRKGKA